MMNEPHLPDIPAGPFRLYLSGPIRGHEDSNRPAFEEAARELDGLGLASLVPLDLSSDKGRNIRTIMWRDIEALARQCHGLYMLDGWQQSLGALAEYHFGLSVGMPVWGRDWFDERNEDPFRCLLPDLCQFHEGTGYYLEAIINPLFETAYQRHGTAYGSLEEARGQCRVLHLVHPGCRTRIVRWQVNQVGEDVIEEHHGEIPN